MFLNSWKVKDKPEDSDDLLSIVLLIVYKIHFLKFMLAFIFNSNLRQKYFLVLFFKTDNMKGLNNKLLYYVYESE